MPPNFATVEKVQDGFKAAGSRMDSIEKEMNLAFAEMVKTLDGLKNGFKSYGRSVLNASERVGDYQGFWRNETMAKEFGLLVMTLAGMKAKDMGTGDNASGGAMVGTETAGWMIQMLGQYGKYRRNALIVLMGSGKLNVPRVTADLTVYCPEEGGEISKSDLDVDLVSLLAKKFACLTVINRELEEDAVVGLGEIVGQSITRSMAKKEDEIGFMGDGTETYFGMLGIIGALRKVDDTINNIKGLVVGSGNAYSELTLADFRNVVGTLPSDADDGAKWYMNKKFYYGVVYPLAEAAGVANLFEILSNQKGRFLLGYPVEFIHCMPYQAANSQICAILGDLKLGAYLGERRQIEIARSTEVLFGNDQVAIRGTERIDVNAHGVGDTTDAGAIVGLITAGS
ncbi:MAG: phage major capsid protein [Sedimentisphaerales bacterium]